MWKYERNATLDCTYVLFFNYKKTLENIARIRIPKIQNPKKIQESVIRGFIRFSWRILRENPNPAKKIVILPALVCIMFPLHWNLFLLIHSFNFVEIFFLYCHLKPFFNFLGPSRSKVKLFYLLVFLHFS